VQAGDVARAKFNSTMYGAQSKLAFVVNKGSHSFTPSVGAKYISFGQSGYRESGSNYNMKVDRRRIQSINTLLALKYGYVLTMDKVQMVPALEVGVNRDLMIKSDDKLNSRFINTGDVFSVSINLPKRTSVFATPSIKLQNNIVDVDLSYTLEKRGAVGNHLGCVKVKLKF
jgi:hypothetical protein